MENNGIDLVGTIAIEVDNTNTTLRRITQLVRALEFDRPRTATTWDDLCRMAANGRLGHVRFEPDQDEVTANRVCRIASHQDGRARKIDFGSARVRNECSGPCVVASPEARAGVDVESPTGTSLRVRNSYRMFAGHLARDTVGRRFLLHAGVSVRDPAEPQFRQWLTFDQDNYDPSSNELRFVEQPYEPIQKYGESELAIKVAESQMAKIGAWGRMSPAGRVARGHGDMSNLEIVSDAPRNLEIVGGTFSGEQPVHVLLDSAEDCEVRVGFTGLCTGTCLRLVNCKSTMAQAVDEGGEEGVLIALWSGEDVDARVIGAGENRRVFHAEVAPIRPTFHVDYAGAYERRVVVFDLFDHREGKIDGHLALDGTSFPTLLGALSPRVRLGELQLTGNPVALRLKDFELTRDSQLKLSWPTVEGVFAGPETVVPPGPNESGWHSPALTQRTWEPKDTPRSYYRFGPGDLGSEPFEVLPLVGHVWSYGVDPSQPDPEPDPDPDTEPEPELPTADDQGVLFFDFDFTQRRLDLALRAHDGVNGDDYPQKGAVFVRGVGGCHAQVNGDVDADGLLGVATPKRAGTLGAYNPLKHQAAYRLTISIAKPAERVTHFDTTLAELPGVFRLSAHWKQGVVLKVGARHVLRVGNSDLGGELRGNTWFWPRSQVAVRLVCRPSVAGGATWQLWAHPENGVATYERATWIDPGLRPTLHKQLRLGGRGSDQRLRIQRATLFIGNGEPRGTHQDYMRPIDAPRIVCDWRDLVLARKAGHNIDWQTHYWPSVTRFADGTRLWLISEDHSDYRTDWGGIRAALTEGDEWPLPDKWKKVIPARFDVGGEGEFVNPETPVLVQRGDRFWLYFHCYSPNTNGRETLRRDGERVQETVAVSFGHVTELLAGSYRWEGVILPAYQWPPWVRPKLEDKGIDAIHTGYARVWPFEGEPEFIHNTAERYGRFWTNVGGGGLTVPIDQADMGPPVHGPWIMSGFFEANGRRWTVARCWDAPTDDDAVPPLPMMWENKRLERDGWPYQAVRLYPLTEQSNGTWQIDPLTPGQTLWCGWSRKDPYTDDPHGLGRMQDVSIDWNEDTQVLRLWMKHGFHTQYGDDPNEPEAEARHRDVVWEQRWTFAD